MKILLVTGRYLPQKSGGIENYTHYLANLLSQHNYLVDIAILNSEISQPYFFDNIEVLPLKNGFQSFIGLLREKAYDVCHFQELSAFGGIELYWFREARKYCEKVFFTFHLPYLTCYKNDFRYKGIEDCNQFNSTERCVECIIATKLNYRKVTWFDFYNWAIMMGTPLLKRTKKIQDLRKRVGNNKYKLEELIELCDSIFIYGKWFKQLLHENGCYSSKLKIIPHISKPDFEHKDHTSSIKYKLLFVGRIENAKGLHLLVKAMNTTSIKNLQLDVAGNIVDQQYFEKCMETYPFNYKGILPRKSLLHSFPDYDFLVLPSVFTEMYSLVLKEAFYEQLPVIVSSAKGNKDVVTDSVNGFLFEYDNAKDLTKAIDRAYQLKKNGWVPIFSDPENPQKDTEEIISYYLSD